MEYNGEKIELKLEKYGHLKNNALSMYDEETGELFMVCSTNVDRKLRDDEVAIKNWSENEGIERWLIENNIIENIPFDFISSGFVIIPIYKLVL